MSATATLSVVYTDLSEPVASVAGGEETSMSEDPGTLESWPEYLRRISGGQTQAQIAERIGIGRLSVCNWLHGKTRPKAETVIAVARVYGRPPIEALLAANYLRSAEVGQPVEVRTSPREISAADLAAEVRRRLTATPE